MRSICFIASRECLRIFIIVKLNFNFIFITYDDLNFNIMACRDCLRANEKKKDLNT